MTSTLRSAWDSGTDTYSDHGKHFTDSTAMSSIASLCVYVGFVWFFLTEHNI